MACCSPPACLKESHNGRSRHAPPRWSRTSRCTLEKFGRLRPRCLRLSVQRAGGVRLTVSVVARPATVAFTRRELFIWFAAILFATKCLQSVLQVSGLSFRDSLFIQAAGINAFQLLAWFVVFRLFIQEPSRALASRPDLVVIGLLASPTFWGRH